MLRRLFSSAMLMGVTGGKDMLLTAEQKCLLWLSNAEVTPGHLQKLLETYETPEEIWDCFGQANGPSFPPAACKVLQDTHSATAVDDLAEKLEHKNVNLLFLSDEEYPPALANIQDPPYLLYYAGRLSCLELPAVALVGTRTPSRYGMEIAAKLASDLARAGVCVVSGLARGIDAAAHQAVLQAEGHTIGVLGSGINVPYPPEHRNMLRKIAGGVGLIISEYPLNAVPLQYHFPHRNRIISGLALGTVFVEGRIQSGGMHTVHSALMQGREVFAIPGQIGMAGSEGPHAILREGARIITSAQDLLDDLGISSVHETKKKATTMVKLNAVQQKIVSQLRVQALMPQEIADASALSVADIMTELGTLEILGVVAREAGNRFYLPLSAK